MEKRIKGEIGPLGKQVAVGAPGNGHENGLFRARKVPKRCIGHENRLFRARIRQAERIEADGDRRGLRAEGRQHARGRIRPERGGQRIREC